MTSKAHARRPRTGGLLPQHGHLLLLAGIVILSFLFNFYAVAKTGYGNAYYAAAVKSMSQSWHNFFYVSFDPAGLVSVDKPPLGLWVQTLFVLVFGYHGWVLLLPQALAGTGSCILLYVLTAKRFGRPAGLIASLVFALTPIVVVAARSNTMDMQLVLALLAATWFLFRAIDTGKWRFLFTAAALIGIGFNIKMLQAYMILPAVAAVYLLFSKERLARRLIASGISLAILAAVSFAWVAAVDLTPASQRPYVDSSTNNTVLELIIGHNGVERLTGQNAGTGGRPSGGQTNPGNGTPPQNQQGDFGGLSALSGGSNAQTTGNSGSAPTNGQSAQGGLGGSGNAQGGWQAAGGRMPGGSSGGMQGSGGFSSSEIGSASPLRLWNASLFGQISWLLPMALFAILASLKRFSFKRRTGKQASFVYWVLWLGTMAAFFSFAGFYHRYYLCMMAPAVAVLTGIAIPSMLRAFQEKRGWKQMLLPLSAVVTLIPAVAHVWSYSQLRSWLVPLLIAAGAASLAAMAAYRLTGKRAALVSSCVLLAVSLLAAPVYWSLTPIWGTPNSTLPYAGPELVSKSGGMDGGMPNRQGTAGNSGGSSSGDDSSGGSYTSLQAYLVAHYKAGSYLVMAQRANDVADLIIDTGLPAVAYGGFLGSDNSLSVAKLQQLVKEGKITYFLLSSQDGGSGASRQDGGESTESIASYVQAHATRIDSSEYGGTQSGSLYLFQS